MSATYGARWILPIDRPPIRDGWIEIASGRIVRLGTGPAPAGTRQLGDAVILPGFVNAHTHLELSWMAGMVAPAESMDQWIRAMLRIRRSGAPGGPDAERRASLDAARGMRATGTVLAGDISNTLETPSVLAEAGLGGVVFHELLGFNAAAPALLVEQAQARALAAAAGLEHVSPRVAVTVAAHAPYSVSSALFREIVARIQGPLAIHVAESAEEMEFVRSGTGPIRSLLDDLAVWNDAWTVPGSTPVQYLDSLGYIRPGLLAVHAVHVGDADLERLSAAGATVVTCPRSNLWVGAGMPRVSHFYASGVPVAIGTDSLASVGSLNLFDELAELRRIAPDVTAAKLLESATRTGADALGFGATHGTLTPGKSAALTLVAVPANVIDVEEYLVSGVAASAVRPLA